MGGPPIAGIALWVLLAPAFGASQARGEDAGPIEDNSFLIEEAYNQGPRVVQHIVTWMRLRGGRSWEAGFTQEWPMGGQRHQLSYTIPVQRLPDSGPDSGPDPGPVGMGDIALNYRFQWLGVGGGPVAFAPRFSWFWPTGDTSRGFGVGSQGVQINLPLSVALSRRWVTHTNAGVTWTHKRAAWVVFSPPPDTRRVLSLGQSLIWLATPRVNLMVELAWERSEAPGYPGDPIEGNVDLEKSLLLAPGLRWAHDFASGLQIVPGIAVPIGLGPSRGERAVFLYLSFEHGF